MAKLFTEEELEELRRADAELEEEFSLTTEDLQFSRQLDRDAKLDRLDNRGRKIAEYQAAYYEANKDKIAAQQAAYREANREKYNAYMREYQRKRREAKKNAAPGVPVRMRRKGYITISNLSEIGGKVNGKVFEENAGDDREHRLC